MAERLTPKFREEVAERALWCCEYCLSQARFSPDPFSIEHIIPRSRGGGSNSSNMAFSCQGCNNYKHAAVEAIDPLSGATVPLFNPRRDRWKDHYVWSDDDSQMLGLTATGRATIVRLKLNRLGVVNLRRVLSSWGEHPP